MEQLNYTIQYTDGEDKGLCVEKVGRFASLIDLKEWADSIDIDNKNEVGPGFRVISIQQ